MADTADLSAEQAAALLASAGITRIEAHDIILCGFANVGLDALASRGAQASETAGLHKCFDGSHHLDRSVHGIVVYAMTTSLAADRVLKQEGDERGMDIIRSTIRHCDGYIYVYDVTNRRSFESLANLHAKFDAEIQITGGSAENPIKVPKAVAVLANKIDVPEDQWEVSREEGEKWATSIGAPFAPTSAKTGEGVIESIMQMLGRVVVAKARLRLENDKFLSNLLADVPKPPAGIKAPPNETHRSSERHAKKERQRKVTEERQVHNGSGKILAPMKQEERKKPRRGWWAKLSIAFKSDDKPKSQPEKSPAPTPKTKIQPGTDQHSSGTFKSLTSSFTASQSSRSMVASNASTTSSRPDSGPDVVTYVIWPLNTRNKQETDAIESHLRSLVSDPNKLYAATTPLSGVNYWSLPLTVEQGESLRSFPNIRSIYAQTDDV